MKILWATTRPGVAEKKENPSKPFQSHSWTSATICARPWRTDFREGEHVWPDHTKAQADTGRTPTWLWDMTMQGIAGARDVLRRKQWHPTPVHLSGKSHGRCSLVGCSPWGRTRLSDFTFTFHFHALEKEMATHSSVLAWRIPGTGEPGGLPSMESHRVGHDWSDLAGMYSKHL